MKIFDKVKSINKYNTVAYISIFILLITGIVPSIIFSDWGWFGRSGALLVVFGIFIIWLDYESIINEDLNIVFSGFRDHLKDSDANLTTSEVDRIEKEIQGKFDEVSDRTKKRYKNIEFFIVAIGTLIWGYGDLMNKVDVNEPISISQIQEKEYNKTLERNSLP